MTDRESDDPELEETVCAWRKEFGHLALISCRQDLFGYDVIEIHAGKQAARVERDADGWCLYDLTGFDSEALAGSVRHLRGLTPAISAFLHYEQH